MNGIELWTFYHIPSSFGLSRQLQVGGVSVHNSPTAYLTTVFWHQHTISFALSIRATSSPRVVAATTHRGHNSYLSFVWNALEYRQNRSSLLNAAHQAMDSGLQRKSTGIREMWSCLCMGTIDIYIALTGTGEQWAIKMHSAFRTRSAVL